MEAYFSKELIKELGTLSTLTFPIKASIYAFIYRILKHIDFTLVVG